MFRKRLKHYGSIGLGSGVALLCLILLTHTQSQNGTLPEETFRVSPRGFRKPLSTPQETLTDFQSSAFYRTIVDNNLFRSLGWTPPHPKEPYRLLGTILPTDQSIPLQAILRSTTARTTYIVNIGDTLDTDTTLIDIQAKQVTLERKGQRKTLTLNTVPWLK